MGQERGHGRRDSAYWRSVVEAYGDITAPGEFPPGVDLPPPGVSRRTLLQLLGASMALAGIGGCAGPGDQHVVAFAGRTPQPDPASAQRYATTMSEQGYGVGLVVEAHAGRPTKIEGNPDHPSSLGACGVFAQASILQLYDPDRSQTIRQGAHVRSGQDLQVVFDQQRALGGQGLAILMEPTSSPCIAERLAQTAQVLAQARIYVHDPLAGAGGAAATTVLGGRYLVRYDMAHAQVIVALDSDLLACGPDHVRHARGFAANRRARHPGETMNRLYVAESTFTCTGSSADHRLRIDDSRIGAAAAYLLEAVLHLEGGSRGLSLASMHTGALDDRMRSWLGLAAADLMANRRRALVAVGPRQPAVVHALVHAINEVLGSSGTTLSYADDPIPQSADLADLARDLDTGSIDTLLILGGNPLATAPADLGLGRLVNKARTRLALGLYENETAGLCQWTIPELHYLETWGDLRAVDGTVSVQQPLIMPLTGGMSVAEVLMRLNGEVGPVRDRLFASWARLAPVGRDSASGQATVAGVLRAGLIPGSAFPARTPSYSWDGLARMIDAYHVEDDQGRGYELSLRPDAKVQDGRYANNPWLQELPEPMTKLTWDNAALISRAAGVALGLTSGDVVRLEHAGHSLEIPVLIVPGQADRTISLALGYGRSGSETTALGVGGNAYRVRSAHKPWFAPGVSLAPTGRRHDFAITQEHWRLDTADIVQERTWSEFQQHPLPQAEPALASLRAAPAAIGRQWAMAIDMSVCIGCNACVVACQAENNIPVVGKNNVRVGREMHWLRIDRYYRGSVEDPSVASQPMMCQHCEKAPCEYVCPTYATTHSSDGLNEMTYNRCVGTRFCSNNCPYKVRRFNWYNFNDNAAPVTRLVHNPDVTVRARGVMEKCTGCVQRIREAEIDAAVAGEPGRPLAIMTACQQTCPTQAIVFGDSTDPNAPVQRLRTHPLAYGVLEETGAQPRTRYLARLSNPNAGFA